MDRATTRTESLCEGVIEGGWLLALGTVLLVVNTYSERSYEPEKAALVRSLAILVVAAWVWKVVAGGRLARPWGGSRPPGFALVPALAAAWAAVVIGGALVSVDPRLSWLGSYARAQGALTELACLIFFAAILAHLRSEAQWRRIALVIVVAGTTAALYGIAQALGLDPINGMQRLPRVHSTAGNAIFLGGSLLMTGFVTALEAARALGAGRRRESLRSGPGRLRAALLALACASQLAALLLTQSRGPFLGLLAGLYLAALVLLLRARSLAARRDSVPSGWGRWLVPAVLAAVLLGMLAVVAANISRVPLPVVRSVPHVGRLGGVLDASSRTVQVRLLIWRAVTDLLASNEPLRVPGGGPDRLHGTRWLIGYGPETFGLAINRHVGPELGQIEDRGRIPDRAHNDTFDRLLMNGLIGTVLWLAICGALFALALGRLGLVASQRERLALWMAMAAGAAIGAAAPWLASGEARLSGVGLSVGFVLSVAVFATWRVLLRAPLPSGPAAAGFGLTLALLATVVAHFVELQVGIAITFTKLAFWCLAAVLVVVSRGGLEPPPGVAKDGPMASRGGAHRARSWAGPVTGLLAVSLCLPWPFTLTVSGAGARTAGRILMASWWGGEGGAHPTVLFWLVAATLVLSAVVAGGGGADAGPVRGRARLATSAAVLLAVGGFAVIEAALIAAAISQGHGGRDVVDAFEISAGLYGWLTWGLLALAVAVGVAVASSGSRGNERSRTGFLATVVVPMIVTVVALTAIQRTSVAPIHADGLMKPVGPLIAAGRTDEALALLKRGRELAPHEPMIAMMRGRAALQAASAGSGVGGQERMFELAESSLEVARRLAPLDPDHWANLARCAAQRARATSEAAERRRLLDRAMQEYAAALELRPPSVLFLNEYGRLLLYAGQPAEGERALQHAVELDPEYADPRLALAALEEARAAASVRGGRREMAVRELERALAQYEQVMALDPESGEARAGAERVAVELARLSEAAP